MKKIMTIFSVMLLIISLSACSPDFNGSRTGNDNQLIMEYTAFNTTDSQDLVVEAGDTIHVGIVIEDGHLSYKIQKNDDGSSDRHDDPGRMRIFEGSLEN